VKYFRLFQRFRGDNKEVSGKIFFIVVEEFFSLFAEEFLPSY